ncbi:IscS subfamily cysteine desulfurase [Neorickettsia helminthoeca]|uniref:IscS subfamily cysteine desulfurase n=1 Tax=Neorickettsia helminthoeca TaxID=33994 RepID=UPI00056DEEB1|nr:IscS subfamily cysteine desulfurase [Neorickettsia helminthoeca]
MDLPVFFDNQSTTRTDPAVLKEMIKFFEAPCNPHSRTHIYGWQAEAAVENAREKVAQLINASPKDIVFTSGATESNNLAIKGAVTFYHSDKKNHVITVATEHKCVLDSCRHLEEIGIKVTYLPVQKNGIVDLDVLRESIKDSTIMVSIMAANNEIGVIQPIKEIGQICKEASVIFHTDAAQAFGKIPLDVEEMNISLMSISGHKIYGPMGVGALYIRRKNPRIRLTPVFNGGGQERGMRSGTVPTPLVAGLGKAAEIAAQNMQEEYNRIKYLSTKLYGIIKAGIPDIVLNGDPEQRLPGNLNISFPYVEGESIIMAITDISVSSGSACTSASLEPSYVLRALGVGDDLAHSSIRFSIGRYNTEEEIEMAGKLVVEKINRLREMSPLWEMAQEGIDLNSIKWDVH